MPRYMLDTDISSYAMKQSHPGVSERLCSIGTGEACISVVTKAELLYGVAVSPNTARDHAVLTEYLRYVEVMDFVESAAMHYAEIRASLKRRGTMIGANDLWIAAHARSLGCILVTNNVRKFERVSGLEVENWADERLRVGYETSGAASKRPRKLRR